MAFEFDWTISLSLLLSIGTIVFAWWRTRRADVDKRLHEGSKKMDGLELRVQAVEQSLAVMPGKDDMHALALALSEMGGDMKAMRATLKATAESMGRIEHIVGRHEDHFREHK